MKQLTEEQKEKLNTLADQYYAINELTMDPDPIVQIVERGIYERTKAKMELEAAQYAANAAGAVHIDYLAKRCIELFPRFGVQVEWGGRNLTLKLPRGYMFTIYANLDRGDTILHSFKYTGQDKYHIPPTPDSYNLILTAAAEWVAKSVEI